MLKIQRTFLGSCLLILLLTTLFVLLSLSVGAQELKGSQATQDEVATRNNPAEPRQPGAALTRAPIYKDFMGVTLGMTAKEVRAKLGHLKDSDEEQDFFVFSESRSAQIVYDDQDRATIISVDYVRNDEGTPSPQSVLGEAVQAKPDGSIYQLKRYPEAGYWVAYSRTAGDNPMVTVTMQKL